MTAVDDAEPGRVATVDVAIDVTRNANPPKFARSRYDVTVSQQTPMGEAIARVNATDLDGVSKDIDLTLQWHLSPSGFSRG